MLAHSRDRKRMSAYDLALAQAPRGAHDEAAGTLGTSGRDDVAQPLAFLLVFDPSRDADVVGGRYVGQT
jgi:hypothetical protein